MKKFTLLLIVTLACTLAFGQIFKERSDFNCKSYNKEAKSNQSLISNNVKEGEALSESFDTWPPTDWTIIDGAESEGTQHWNQGGSEANYFAQIQWDNNGDGTARPQDEWLITPAVTVPADGYLSFRAHTNPYWMDGEYNNADVFVKISTDDGATWTQLWHEDDEEMEYDIWKDVFIDLDTYVGQNVKIAFQYLGEDACWFNIDDVTIYTFPEFNVELTDFRVNFFEVPDYVTEPTEFHLSSHYQMIPIEELEGNDYAYLAFNAIVINKGYGTCTPQCSVSVLDPNSEEVFSSTSINTETIGEFGVDTIDIAFTDPFVLNAPEIGVYTVNYTITYEASTKEILVGSTTFEVTESLYARENGNVNGSTGPSVWVGGQEDGNKMAVVYTLFEDTEITSMDVFISPESTTGTSLIGHIMAIEGDNWYELASSLIINIEETDIATWKNITFTDIANIIIGEEYDAASVLLAIEFYYDEEDSDLLIGEDQTVPSSFWGTKWALGEDAPVNSFPSYTNYTGVPMIRMNLDEEGVAPQTFAQTNINMYPNPSTGVVTISNVKEGATIKVINLMGQTVASVENANKINNINLSNIANGTYIIKITSGSEIATSKLNLQK